MSHINPKILSKLHAFAERRRKLIIIRGICTAVAMLLATMMIVAVIDWLFVLPDAARWGLSGAAYLAVLIAEWRTCLRLLAHAPGPRRLARLLEHAEPKLREDLLSAVELGSTADKDVLDSPQFRELVQQDVAARVENLDVERLLPVNLLRRYIIVAAVIGVALIGMFVMTGLQFGTLFLRAMAPMANLARVSRFKVTIVEPKPAEQRVAHGEAVPLLVEISGGRTNKAVLEIFTKGGGREKVPMTPASGDRFSATIQVAREDVDYRVRAGDAITRKFRLDAEPRPHVLSFEKTYTLPAYTRVGTKKVVEENGDLAAIEGSEVELRLETNQKIKTAELHVEQAQKQNTIHLLREGNRLIGKLPMHASGTYRVHLVAEETGFENKFSPEYEIRAEPDLVPQVELETPQHDLILPANELVEIRGSATDDQSLANVSQMVRINEGPWVEVQLAKEPGQKAAVARRWDLYEQGVKPGDLLTTKLLAVDLKGSKSESRAVQISIISAGFEAKRMSSLEAQRQLLEALKELRAAAETLEKTAGESRGQYDRAHETDPVRGHALVSAQSAFDEFGAKSAATWTQLVATLRAAAPGHETADLALLARVLAKMDSGTAEFGRDALEIVAANPSAAIARDQMREFADFAARATQRARMAEETYRGLVGSEELDVLTEKTHVVAREQARLAKLAEDVGSDAKKSASLANRMRIVLAETRSIEDLMEAAAEHVPTSQAERLRRIEKYFEKDRLAIEQRLAPDATDKNLLEPARKLAAVSAEHATRFLEMRRDSLQGLNKRMGEMLQDVGPTWTNFEKLRAEAQQIQANDRVPPETRARLVERRWQLRGGLLKLHGDAEEARPDADARFVSDVRATSLAMRALREAIASAAPGFTHEKLVPLDKAFRILECAHNISEVADGLKLLVTAERWEVMSPRARTTAPRDWEWLESRLRTLPDELGKTEADEATRKIVQEAQKIFWELQRLTSTRIVNEEMSLRARPEREPVAVPDDVAQVEAQVRQALDLLRKPIDDARLAIAQMAPKLHELMAQLAKDAEELKKETEEQAKNAEQAQPEKAQADAQKALAEQQKLNDNVEALKDALRAEANEQNILQKEGREAARDADDALAMLKEPPPKAEAALQQAAEAAKPIDQKQALTEAAQQQQKLADALHMLAQHFEKAEQGNAEEMRAELRAQEQELGVKEQLDQQYAKAEQMAQMAQQSPQEMIKQLEKALPQNPQMQKELSQISQSTLASAEQKLAQASQQENQIANDLLNPPQQAMEKAANAAAEAAKQAAQAAEAAKQAANAAKDQAKQAANPQAAKQANRAEDHAAKAAEAAQQAMQAAQEMASAPQPEKAAQSAQKAAERAAKAADAANQAAAEAKQAQASAQQAAKTVNDKQAPNQQSAAKSDEAAKSAEQAAQLAQQAQKAAQQSAQEAQRAAQQMQQAANNVMQAARQAAQAAEAGKHMANAAEQQANQAANQPAAQQAKQAADQAAKAVQSAQQAAQAAEQIAKSSQPQQAAQQAAQKAGEAAQMAQQAAAQAKQAEASSQQAAQGGGEKQPINQQSAKTSAESAKAAEKAAQLAQQAQQAAQQMAGQAPQTSQASPQLAQAAQQQAPIANATSQAAEQVSRAGRHEERLQNMPAGEQLQQLGSEIAETANAEVPAAQQALAMAQNAAQAQAALNAANTELAKELGQLQSAASAPPRNPQPAAPAGQPPQTSPQAASPAPAQPAGSPPQQTAAAQSAQQAASPAPAQPKGAQPAAAQAPSGQPMTMAEMLEKNQFGAQPASAQEQMWMARTLDALDQALNAQAGSQQAQQGQSQQSQEGQQQAQSAQGQPQPSQAAAQAMAQAQSAMQAAAAAAAAEMRGQRSESASPTPGEDTPQSAMLAKSQGGARVDGEPGERALLQGELAMKGGQWGKLPKKVAEELSQGQRESVAGEYRQQIETYYRVIAEKAKKP